MKQILFIIAVLVLLTGCTITGQVVREIENPTTQEQKDLEDVFIAIENRDVEACYSIETQQIREDCFITIAEETKDASVCKNLLGKTLRANCVQGTI